MPDNITTPTPNGSVLAFKDVGSVLFALNMLVDSAGTDAMGTVAGTPVAGTLLGRLKAIADGVATLAGHVDGLEGLSTALNGFVDGLEGLIGTTNTTLTTLGGYVDGLETLQGTANATLAAISGFVDGLETLLAAATPAGENYIGKLGGDVLSVVVTPAVSASPAYSVGDVIGGKLTFAALARASGGSGVIQSVVGHCKSLQTAAIDLLLFSSDPATTFTDNAALALGAADFDKLIGVVHLTDWTSLGASGPAMLQYQGLAMPFKLPAGTTIYAVLVARNGFTLASTSDLKLTLNVIPG